MLGRERACRVVLIADAHGARVYAVEVSTCDLRAEAVLNFAAEPLSTHPRLPDLETFAAAHGLRGRPATVLFSGAGTVVQKLSLPPLPPRARHQAVRTRLTNYAGGATLITDCVTQGARGPDEGVPCLAAGVDANLVRGLLAACERAGLRVERVSTTAAVLDRLADAERAVQIFVADRFTTIQLFDDGLLLCREIPLGRRDLEAAYQRPILTPDGPVTLSADEAREMLREVGVPVGPPRPVRPNIHTPQLWPLLTPVLRRFQDEIDKTLEHGSATAFEPDALCALVMPPIPGLGAHLAGELGLQDASPEGEDGRRALLCALTRPRPVAIDLRPPEERLAKRLWRPAWVAAALAALTIGLNASAPQPARGAARRLAPAARDVRRQAEHLARYCAALEERLDEAVAGQRRTGRLLARLAAPVDLVAPFKLVFGSRPAGVRIREVDLWVRDDGVVVDLRCLGTADQPAGVVAADWTRVLKASPLVRDASVASIADSGDGGAQTMHLRIVMEP